MPPSPATQFTNVVVVDDQTGRQWNAGAATIREGLIVVASPSPPGMCDATAHTYTITAKDRADRLRRFDHVVLAWREEREVAFR